MLTLILFKIFLILHEHLQPVLFYTISEFDNI